MSKKLLIALVAGVLSAASVFAGKHNGGRGGGGGGGDGGGSGDTTLTTFETADFTGSGNCAMCHSGLIDGTGKDVSMDWQWRSTMMANAAKDPLWQAKISSEVIRNPSLSAVIEDKCSRCHTPMARVQAVTDGTPIAVLGDGFLNSAHYLHEAAMDGVSCSLCHQIDEAGLGTEQTFTGDYVIDTSTTSPYRWIYGTFADPFQGPMRNHVGFTPVQGTHVNESSYCATCHTLYTPIVDTAGNVVGEFPEQTPYLEWEHSSFSDPAQTQHCQNCHTPAGPGATPISNRPHWLSARYPVGQHTMVGGNSFLVGILKMNATELGVTADAANLDATIALTTEQLAGQTGQLSILNESVQNDVLTVELQVSNQAGHKLPTGVPLRRVWLHVRVTDKGGQVIFESGAPWSDGRITGNNADNFADQFEPHYDVITTADQVQIYETIMRNTDNQITYTFLNAAGYLKDNRLLPQGFDKSSAEPDIGVYGAAAEDQNFTGGSDLISYQIDISRAQLPVQFSARLLYQPVGRRFMEDLRTDNTTEVQRFAGYYDAADKTPVVIATAQ